MRRTLPAHALWIAVLLVALLPWRAWAWATMHAPAVPAITEQTAWVDHDTTEPPCHADNAHTDEPDAGPSPQACSHCDLCHAGLAPLTEPAWATLARPDVPLATSSPWIDGGRADTPFRPPR